MSVSAASLCAHAGAPSFPPSRARLQRPRAPFVVDPGRCGRGARDPRGRPRARADPLAGRPPRATRSGKLGRTAAAVSPAPQSEWRLLRSRPRASGGEGETRRAPWAPCSPLLPLGEAGRARLTGEGDPHTGTRPQIAAVPGWFGEFAGCPVQIWGGLSHYGSLCFPDCGWSLVVRGTSQPPGTAPGPECGLAARFAAAEPT